KVAVLALGYQGGPGAFAQMARGYGVDVSNLDVPQIVEAWRDAHPEVAGVGVSWWPPPPRDGVLSRRVRVRRGGLWRKTKDAAWAAVQGLGPRAAGRVTWCMDGPHLTATLP